MDDAKFEQAMETIRNHADKIYVFEGNRKPIVFCHAKKHNDNVDDLISEVNEFCNDRLDIILVSGYDLVTVGENNEKVEVDGDFGFAVEL